MVEWIVIWCCLWTICILSYTLYIKQKLNKNKRGGGERVLWLEVCHLLENFPSCKIIIYTSEETTVDALTEKVYRQFGIRVLPKFSLVFLESSFLLEPKEYPWFTLLGQAIGSMFVAIEALLRYTPNCFVDTTGFPASMSIARFCFGCYVVCYVHYPTVSKDMLQVVRQRQVKYNNRTFIAKSYLATQCKLFYYRVLMFLYFLTGKCADVVMVNSSWTKQHISVMWKPEYLQIVYPPCSVKTLLDFCLSGRKRHWIVSLSQFREEKNHILQLFIIQKLVQQHEEKDLQDFCLVMMGSTRNEQDVERVSQLQKLAGDLNIASYVRWVINASHEQIYNYLSKAAIALHTMRDEHFGISVVEFMAAGVIPIAHRSGGVAKDIITHEQNGYLASNLEEYVAILERLLFQLSEEQLHSIQCNMRTRVAEFSDETFASEFTKHLLFPRCSPVVEYKKLYDDTKDA
ncbi:GDP-Man:Man(3)GlcNAc(2)-PP-Dol alpha-1,2-mannosyltransferase [Galdieria sulphuraria]|nr:GDP-Man:Man(3)GlcNAc(2)-PP-Dol alpha-1,2-mannosyltransferase [Galdieria sulphuraria]